MYTTKVIVVVEFFFFFFKQKTAYEMRISDWSSDVCSSDLLTKSLLLYVSGRRALLYRASPGSIPGRSTKFSFWLGGQFDDRCYDPDTDNLADFKSAAQCGADRFPRSL